MAGEENIIKRIPPHSTEAERSVIGSMILDDTREAVLVATELLERSDFYEERYGISKFKDLPLDVIKQLIGKGYLDPDDYQNCSPTVSTIVKFVEEHDPANWRFHGYVVSAERDDTRVSIEGINSLKPLGKDDLIDFLQEFRYADELDAERDETVYCWYV